MISQNIKKCIFGVMLIVTITSNSVSGKSVISKPQRSRLDKSVQMFVAKTISEMVIIRLEEQLRDRNVDQNPRATLLPPADDPACINPVYQELNISLPDIPLTVVGHAALTSPAYVTGLSKIVDDFNLRLVLGGARINWDFSLPAVKIEGEYDLEVNLDIGGNKTDILGSGSLVASVDEVILQIDAIINLPALGGNIGLRTLTLDVGFSNLAIDAEAATINGNLIEWPSKSEEIQNYFDAIWTDETKPVITEAIRCSIDHVINNCTVVQLTNSTDCLKIEINEECLEGLIPSTLSIGKTSLPRADLCPVNTNTDGTTAPGGDGTTTPGSDGTTAPGGDGTTTPGNDGTTTPGSDGTTTPSSDGTTTPGSDGTTTPGSDGTTAPGSDGTTAPGSDGTTSKPEVTTGSGAVSLWSYSSISVAITLSLVSIYRL